MQLNKITPWRVCNPQLACGMESRRSLVWNHHEVMYGINPKVVGQAQSKEELHNLLSSFDNANAKLISDILGELKFASDMDIRVTNDRLTGFLENLSSNVWFTLKLISLDYHLLESVDMAQRKEFLKDVDALIKKYTDTQKIIKNTETY